MSAFWNRFVCEEETMALGGCPGKTEHHPGQNIFFKHQVIIPQKMCWNGDSTREPKLSPLVRNWHQLQAENRILQFLSPKVTLGHILSLKTENWNIFFSRIIFCPFIGIQWSKNNRCPLSPACQPYLGWGGGKGQEELLQMLNRRKPLLECVCMTHKEQLFLAFPS